MDYILSLMIKTDFELVKKANILFTLIKNQQIQL